MSAIDTTRPAAAGLRGVFTSLVTRLAAWNDTRLTRHALSKLSDRELDDIGLTRDDIGRIGF